MIITLERDGTYSAGAGKCPETNFQCPDYFCLPVFLRCNGVFDCLDHSDELLCELYAFFSIDVKETASPVLLDFDGSHVYRVCRDHRRCFSHHLRHPSGLCPAFQEGLASRSMYTLCTANENRINATTNKWHRG